MASTHSFGVLNSNRLEHHINLSNNGGTSKSKTSLGRSVTDVVAGHSVEVGAYDSELVRNRSALQVAFMSFVLASIPYGLATTLFYPLINGGSSTMIWGWLLVSAIILCVAASLAEITSVYPTAGGVYYQTFMLSSIRLRRVASWICGWCYVIGNILITLAVNFGTTLFIVGCVNVFEQAPGVGVFQAETYQIFLIFVTLTLFCNVISSVGNRWLPWIDVSSKSLQHNGFSMLIRSRQTFAILWTFAGLIALVVCTLSIARNSRRTAHEVFWGFQPLSGWPSGWAFCVGLLHAAYATSSTGMIISYVFIQTYHTFDQSANKLEHVGRSQIPEHAGSESHGWDHPS